MYFPYFDPTYVFVIIGIIICMAASGSMRSTYARFGKIRNKTGVTGAQAAREILNQAGLFEVQVQHIAGDLTDHYDPRKKVLSLSDTTYNSSSVAAVGVAAHECGHAIQHAEGYAALNFRSALVPVANFGSVLAWPMIILGFIFNSQMSTMFINIGIILFSLSVLFHIVTLPVEFNASGRALKILGNSRMLDSDELGGAKKVLSAAALTYVAAAAASILQLLRILLLSNRRND